MILASETLHPGSDPIGLPYRCTAHALVRPPNPACTDEALVQSVVHVIGLLVKSVAKDWADLPPERIEVSAAGQGALGQGVQQGRRGDGFLPAAMRTEVRTRGQ